LNHLANPPTVNFPVPTVALLIRILL